MRILVIGRAQGVWEEVDAAHKLICAVTDPFDLVVAVNHAGCDYSHVDHWVSFHGDSFEGWQKQRDKNGYPLVLNLWTSTYGRKESRYEKMLGAKGVRRINYTGGGSSGLVATFVAMVPLRGTHIVLAGIPMEIERGHYNSPGPWKEANKHRKAWRDQIDELRLNVRSMSGWTAEQLGYPDEAWLRADLAPSTIELS